jgi:hypothetical protein
VPRKPSFHEIQALTDDFGSLGQRSLQRNLQQTTTRQLLQHSAAGLQGLSAAFLASGWGEWMAKLSAGFLARF